MAVISTDKELNDRIERVTTLFSNEFEPEFIDNEAESLEFLKYELPEVNIINYSDSKLDMATIIAAIKSDPWLHYGGVIAVHNSKDRHRCQEDMAGINLIATLSRQEFVQGFYRVLGILKQNRQVIFQRDLQAFLMKSLSGSLVMDNDPLNVRIYANLLSNYLFNSNYINADMRDRVHVALHEMLMNAVEHGNCEISYEEKTDWLETHGDILELIRFKCKDPVIRNKKVFFSYRISEDRSIFTIRDEGTGFDWQTHVEKKDHSKNLGLHGRGIAMTGIYVSKLMYNDIGNEVTFEILHQKNESNMLPSIFMDHAEMEFEDGDVIFREGETSDNLYYIVSGTLEIVRDNKSVSRLTPDDLFLGEMSFLLTNKRSATVISRGKSVLVPVSKHSFVNIIKEQPHYGIFLARLLAHRLERMNSAMVAMQSRHSELI
jgi:anti-sigma regulatory factor (Ser/Thr protein kinase)